MRNSFAWLGAAMLVAVWCSTARAGDPLKPYVVLVLDTSGSMDAPTGSGPPSCGGGDTRLEHATCAINRITNSYGDMVFALGRFRETVSGTFTNACDANRDLDGNPGQTFPTPSGGDQCSTQGVYCGDCNESIGLGDTCGSNGECFSGICSGGRCVGAGTCTTADRELEMLTGLVDGNNQLAAGLTDRSCGSCLMPTGGNVTTAHEIWGVSPYTFTPLAAVLNGAKSYWLGNALATDGTTVIWPSSAPGFAPIFNDVEKTKFLPAGCNPSPTCTTNCCATQCRPYITILLTDGGETCTSFNNTTAAASSLLSTDIQGRRYRVETKPIGFGIAPGNAQIEAIAHAGGEPDLVGNEGFYAANEAELQLAISSILADAIKTESCNAADDDCDTLIDEDFPTVGQGCTNGRSGICRVDGELECRVDGTGVRCDAGIVAACTGQPNGTACTVTNTSGTTVAGTCTTGVCNPTPQVEVCNSIDDDCDGKVDENLGTCSCAPQGEACDNDDDDCDGRIDEGITRPCGTGTCQGIETCTAGVFGGCTAATPTAEVCDGLDNNCDGIRDGLQAECSTMPPLPPENFPIDDPRNNPGHPSNNPIPENICRPGQKVCPANVGPPNSFGACQGEIKPCNGAANCLDLCDGLDQDCDNDIDEDFAPADCSTNCGIGTTSCVNGMIQCNAVQAMDDTTCNNVDDDCDNVFDEDWVSPGACGTGVVCNGLVECINGMETCVGGPIEPESCDCDDDDCDTLIDEGNLCAPGASCTSCQCAFPCGEGEFPCPMGKFCKDNFCIADPCFGVTCQPLSNGDITVCRPNAVGNDHACVRACDLATCLPNEVCIGTTGECKPDNCHTFPERCTENQNCIAGACVTNLCKNVTCGTGQYCVAGQCYGSCADVDCPDGQRCRLGMCERDPCGGRCPFGQVCISVGDLGSCVADPCPFLDCPQGQICDPNVDGGACVDDLCIGTMCPDPSEVCKGDQGGTCFDPADFLPDGGPVELVTTGGGGGCSTGGATATAGLWLGLALWLGTRRRRRTAAHGRGGRS